MASQVAWLSFDAEQQRRTQLMMLALSDQSTVDELGLGTMRDLIAGALHPGMTVLHTRARYLVFVPRIYRALTSRMTDRLLVEGRQAEVRLSGQLAAHYRDHPEENGVGNIGRRRGENTKNLASTLYWPLLRSLGIVRIGGSVTDYCRHRAEFLSTQHARALLHSDDDTETAADGAWDDLPVPDDDAPVSFDLPPDEAEWVRERFVRREAHVPHAERSILAWLLDADRKGWVSGVGRIWDHPASAVFPSETAGVMFLGRDVDRIVHGTWILYNWLCAQGVPAGDRQDELIDRYETAMRAWIDELNGYGVPPLLRLQELHGWVERRMAAGGASQRALIRWQTTYRFLRRWQERVESDGDLLASKAAAQLVTDREAALKPGRARLRDRALLTDWQGGSGYGRFDYNWSVAQRMLADIHAGLGSEPVDLPEAG